MTPKNKGSGIVYSTKHGKMCPVCDNPIAKCVCKQKEDMPKGDGIVRIGKSTKGRKGKVVTVITGMPLNSEDLQKLAKKLKQKCSSGGTVKDGIIEIQGDHRKKLVEELKQQGYTVRLSGGAQNFLKK